MKSKTEILKELDEAFETDAENNDHEALITWLFNNCKKWNFDSELDGSVIMKDGRVFDVKTDHKGNLHITEMKLGEQYLEFDGE